MNNASTTTKTEADPIDLTRVAQALTDVAKSTIEPVSMYDASEIEVEITDVHRAVGAIEVMFETDSNSLEDFLISKTDELAIDAEDVGSVLADHGYKIVRDGAEDSSSAVEAVDDLITAHERAIETAAPSNTVQIGSMHTQSIRLDMLRQVRGLIG